MSAIDLANAAYMRFLEQPLWWQIIYFVAFPGLGAGLGFAYINYRDRRERREN